MIHDDLPYTKMIRTLRELAYATYCTNFNGCKNDNLFQLKMIDVFLVFVQNIDCGYSVEPPHRGVSNVYPQSMFKQK